MYINFLFRAFATSKIYRELKLRSAILKDKQLKVLPKETLINTLHGVWNLSSDQVLQYNYFIVDFKKNVLIEL